VDTIATDIRRTIVFMFGPTVPGQDMFLRGGIDHTASVNVRHVSCVGADGVTPNYRCAIPLYLNNDQFNATTRPWLAGDHYLDWYGAETSTPLLDSAVSRVWGPQSLAPQSTAALGTPANWTTNNAANANKVAVNGFGYTPVNHWGDHNWMIDVMMDCAKAFRDSSGNSWFEIKSFISGGPGWEGNVAQGTVQGFTPPYASANHFAICGMVNRFQRGTSAGTEFAPIPSPAPAVEISSPPLY
jgi:alpha-amylase